MRNVWSVAVAVVALLALGSGYWLVRAGSADAKAEKRLERRFDRLEQRLAKLEQARASDAEALRVALARSRAWANAPAEAATLEGAEQPLDADFAGDEELEPLDAAAERERSREEARARAEALLSKYDQEALKPVSDPSWSTPTMRAARATIQSVIPGARILKEHCGDRTCRILVEHAPGDNAAPQHRDMQNMPPFNQGSTLAHTPADGNEPARSRLYLHRPETVAAAE